MDRQQKLSRRSFRLSSRTASNCSGYRRKCGRMYYNIPSRWFLSKSFVQMNLLPRSSLSFPYSCIAVSSSGMSTYGFSSCHLWHTLRPQVSFVSMHLRDSYPRILTWTPLLSNVSPHSRRCRAARVNSMGGDNHEGVRTLLGTFHGP